MSKRAKQAACAAVALSIFASAEAAHACSGTETQVYKSSKTAWCVEKSVITKYGAFPTAFFAYSDSVVDELVTLFGVPAEGLYTFEASVPNGSAHTGSECCGLGVTVTGDAFYNNGYGAVGFWGYLLSLHEMINDFTGQVSGGWPTDFWADHVSAFPNSMDWHIMATLGASNNNQNLTKASAAQKARFYPGGDSVDARVGMFDKIFDLPNYGYNGYSRAFALVKSEGLSWDKLGVPNADVKRTEYVMAYLSLSAKTPVTSIMKAAHVGDGTPSGAGDNGYVVSQANIDSIATAHCAIAAASKQGIDVTADKKALLSGNYAGVKAAGKCGTGCPDICGCKASTGRCVAPWLASTSTTSTSTTSADNEGAGTASGASDGATSNGGEVTPGGSAPAAGGDVSSSSGSGAGTDGDVSGSNGIGAGSCGIRAAGEGNGAGLLPLVLGSALAALRLRRARARRR